MLPIATAGSPSAATTPCADTVNGTARRIHWPDACAPPGFPRPPRAPPTPPCAGARAARAPAVVHGTTHGLRMRSRPCRRARARRPRGPASALRAHARAPAKPVVAPEAERARASCAARASGHPRQLEQRGGGGELRAAGPPAGVAGGEHHDPPARPPRTHAGDRLELPPADRCPCGSRRSGPAAGSRAPSAVRRGRRAARRRWTRPPVWERAGQLVERVARRGARSPNADPRTRPR